MIPVKQHAQVATALEELLVERFDSVTVRVGDDIHYKGTNVIITCPEFAGWLPEQRFHHVVRAIPADFYERHLRRGVVWFELAPGESPAAYMKMPRSEDIESDEATIAGRLRSVDFYARLQAALNGRNGLPSADDFVVTKRLLAEAGLDDESVTRACLFLIRQGAYCDAQVLADVVPKMAVEQAR
jgi:hypothetical protein